MIKTIISGGIVMIPIILCGVIAIYIVIERIIYFASIKKKDKILMEQLKLNLEKQDWAAAEANCIVASTPTSSVIRKVIQYRHLQEKDLKEIVQTEMDGVVPKFEHLLTALATVASISTLLGLLGTVTGNIKAFGVLGNGGSMGDPALLANAIAEALITTVGGLVVAIPSMVFNNFFNSLVNHRIRDMEANVTEFVMKITGKGI